MTSGAFPPLTPLKVRGDGASDAGPARRVNEDAYGFFEDGSAALAVVSDGMGGGNSSFASGLVVKIARDLFTSRTDGILDDLAEIWWRAEHEPEASKHSKDKHRTVPYSALPIADRVATRHHVERLMRSRAPETQGDLSVLSAERRLFLGIPERALGQANDRLLRLAETQAPMRDVEASGAIAFFADGQVSIAHVGSCRILRVRGSIVTPLTQEHTVYQDAKNNPATPADVLEVARAEYGDVISRAIGRSPVLDASSATHSASPGDVFVLMTAGAWKLFSLREIADEIIRHGVSAAIHLVRSGSKDRPGHPGDNLTCVVAQIL